MLYFKPAKQSISIGLPLLLIRKGNSILLGLPKITGTRSSYYHLIRKSFKNIQLILIVKNNYNKLPLVMTLVLFALNGTFQLHLSLKT